MRLRAPALQHGTGWVAQAPRPVLFQVLAPRLCRIDLQRLAVELARAPGVGDLVRGGRQQRLVAVVQVHERPQEGGDVLRGELAACLPGILLVDSGDGIARRVASLTAGQSWPDAAPPGIAVVTRLDDEARALAPAFSARGFATLVAL